MFSALNDSRSVEEILKEAESIVRASTPYFEKRSVDNSISQYSWPSLVKLKNSRRSKSVDKNEKLNSLDKVIEDSNRGTENKMIEILAEDHDRSNVVSNTEVEDNEIFQTNDVPKEENFNKDDNPSHESDNNEQLKLVEHLDKVITIEKSLESKEDNKLSLSDLATPVNNATFTLNKPVILATKPSNLDTGIMH